MPWHAPVKLKENFSMTISAGKEVSIEYTLKLEDGSLIATNVGAEPMVYVHGSNQIVTGLENALAGMAVGETKKVTLPPDDCYGLVDMEAFREIEKRHVPAEALRVGQQVQRREADGETVHARIAEIKEDSVVLDFNHPLAGRTLCFEVKVLDIQSPTH
jgi:FKBP-type peptidyl-prolyl cis-trans isomerase SlyD